MNNINKFIEFCDVNQQDETEILVGEFIFEYENNIVMEETLIGDFSIGKTPKSKNKIENKIYVKVYGRENKTPHFHVTTKDNTINACFKICENTPFNHSDFHNKIPTKKSIFAKKLYKFMTDLHNPIDESLAITNWEYTIQLWNENNPLFNIPQNKIPKFIPDSSNMIWD